MCLPLYLCFRPPRRGCGLCPRGYPITANVWQTTPQQCSVAAEAQVAAGRVAAAAAVAATPAVAAAKAVNAYLSYCCFQGASASRSCWQSRQTMRLALAGSQRVAELLAEQAVNAYLSCCCLQGARA